MVKDAITWINDQPFLCHSQVDLQKVYTDSVDKLFEELQSENQEHGIQIEKLFNFLNSLASTKAECDSQLNIQDVETKTTNDSGWDWNEEWQNDVDIDVDIAREVNQRDSDLLCIRQMILDRFEA